MDICPVISFPVGWRSKLVHRRNTHPDLPFNLILNQHHSSMIKILVIEDNRALRENTAELLELSDFEVVTASNGVEGVDQALEHTPDLIICDIMMPELDGFGVLQCLQNSEKCRQTPFIFLTAKTEKAEVQTGLARGADEYLTKPFDDSELLNAVERQLTRLRDAAANGSRECAA